MGANKLGPIVCFDPREKQLSSGRWASTLVDPHLSQSATQCQNIRGKQLSWGGKPFLRFGIVSGVKDVIIENFLN
jgi:hypothetical protein